MNTERGCRTKERRKSAYRSCALTSFGTHTDGRVYPWLRVCGLPFASILHHAPPLPPPHSLEPDSQRERLERGERLSRSKKGAEVRVLILTICSLVLQDCGVLIQLG